MASAVVDLWFYPVAAGMTLVDLAAAASESKFLACAAGLAATVAVLKFTTGRQRPDGTSFDSFPSGHSAIAFFLAASFCYSMYSFRGAVAPPVRVLLVTAAAVAVAWALAVAWSRVALQRHHVSDVIVGGAMGVAFAAFVTVTGPTRPSGDHEG